MLAQLGSVGVGLTVAFVLFMLVLSVELYYVWSSRKKRRAAETWSRRTEVKQVQRSSKWRHIVAASWSEVGAAEVKRWAVKLCHHSSAQAATGIVVEERLEAAAQGRTLEDGKKQVQIEQDGEEKGGEEEDVFRVGGLLGPPRLLFTIKEETKEELELEESRSAGRGCKGSHHRASHASGDFILDTSACTSPFVTPPSSPPFATPFGSPVAPHLPLPFCCKTVQDTVSTQDMDSSSSSSSSSSPPPSRHYLSALFEESSSFSSSSSMETPAFLSPSLPPPSTTSPIKRQRHPLSLLLDPPPSPSSALYHYHNRVHPLIPLPPPYTYHLHMPGSPLAKPVEHLTSSSSFYLPAPSQPTTPHPFRASLSAKSMGLIVSATSVTTLHLTEV